MHRHYGGIPDGITPAMLVKMIQQGITWDIEREIKPLWYLRVVKDALAGQETTITVRQMIDEALKTKPITVRKTEEIERDFKAIIARDRRDNG